MGLLKNKAVGLEMDALEARVVELSGNPKEPRVESIGRISLPEESVKDGTIVDPEKVGQALSELWSRLKIRKRDVVLGVSNPGVLVRTAAFAKVPKDKLDNLIRYQAQEFLPVAMETAVLDYMVIGEFEDEQGPKLEVLLVAAQRSMLDGFINALSMAHLEPLDIDVSSLAILRLLPFEDRNKAVAMVHMNNEIGNIVVAATGIPRLARMIPTSLKKNRRQTSAAMDEKFFEHDSLNREFPEDSYLDWCEQAAGEISSSIAYFQRLDIALPIEKIILSGCGDWLDGLIHRLKESFEIPIAILKPFANMKASSNFDIISSREESDFAVSVSLALRGLEENVW